MSSRNKIIWWCCLIRDQTIAIGLRRPHRLHIKRENPTWSMVTFSDFGAEAICPRYMSLTSKRVMIVAFIRLYRLSELMAEIVHCQQAVWFSREWRAGPEEENVVAQTIADVQLLATRLTEWSMSFSREVAVITGQEDVETPV
jgi:hypothetical protein